MTEDQTKDKRIKARLDYAYHAKKWESSGINQKDYCKAQGLNYQSFVTSRIKLLYSRGQSRRQNPKFIPVHTPNSVSINQVMQENNKSSAIILRLPKGSVIELPATLKPAQLSTILKSLGSQLC